jgi:carbon dioxide concentrating mechanism protein CcmN
MPVSTTDYYVSGDVTIRAGAAIAPGVLLQADPGCRIVICASVCVGLGSVIHAHAGAIEVGEGVIIGAGVLLLGSLVVGDRACVGSGTTVMNRSIERLSIVPPGSLMVQQANVEEVAEPTEEVFEPGFCPPPPEQKAVEEIPQVNNGAAPKVETAQTNGAKPSSEMNGSKQAEPQESDEIESPTSQESQPNGTVYGQDYVNRMLGRMFPNQQRLDGNGQSTQ